LCDRALDSPDRFVAAAEKTTVVGRAARKRAARAVEIKIHEEES